MAKASELSKSTEGEAPCCARARRRALAAIQRDYLSFPVIKDLVCPVCKRVQKIRVYSREEAASAARP